MISFLILAAGIPFLGVEDPVKYRKSLSWLILLAAMWPFVFVGAMIGAIAMTIIELIKQIWRHVQRRF